MNPRIKLYGVIAGVLALLIAGFALAETLSTIDSNIVTVPTPPLAGYSAYCTSISTSTISVSWIGSFIPPATASLYGSNSYNGADTATTPLTPPQDSAGNYLDQGLPAGTPRWYRVDTKLNDGSGMLIKGTLFTCTSAVISSDTPTRLLVFANDPTTLFLNWKDNVTSTAPYSFEIQRIKVTPNTPTSTATSSPVTAVDVPLQWVVAATSTPYYTLIERSTSTATVRRFDPKNDSSYQSFSTGSWDPLVSGDPHTFTYDDTSIRDATLYYYRFKTCSSIPIGGLYTTPLSGKEQFNPGSTKPSPACSIPKPSDAGMIIMTPPLAPANVTATAKSDSAIDLSWTNRSVNATGLIIERSIGTQNNFSILAKLGKNTTSYSDTNLNAGTQYYYRIRAYKDFGNGTTLYSDWVFADAITDFDVMVTVTGGDGSVSSNPSGISKCTSACSAVFPSGTSVTLTATSTKATSTFSFWSGNWCNGSTNASCIIYGNASVSALFSASNSSVPLSQQIQILNPSSSGGASASKTSGTSNTSNILGNSGVFTASPPTPNSPLILSVAGMTALPVGQQESWYIDASDPNNETLTYSATWGDGTAASPPQSSTTLTHTYSATGTYLITFSVTNSSGATGQMSVYVDVVVVSPSSPTGAAPTNLQGTIVSPLKVLLTWDQAPGVSFGYRGGYNIYRNGNLWARTSLLYQLNSTVFYDDISCPSTLQYQVQLFSYDNTWNIVPSSQLSNMATVVNSACNNNPTVAVLSPNGGTYKTGDTIHITWKATGAPSTAVSIYNLRADNNYYGVPPVFGVTTSNTVSAQGIVLDTGFYDWTIPSTFSPGQYVVVVGSSYAITAYSAPFSITNAQASLLDAVGSMRNIVVKSVTIAWNTFMEGVHTILSLFRARVPIAEGQSGNINYDAYFAQATSTSPIPSQKDKGLLPDTVYLYRVRAVYGNGQKSLWSLMTAGKTLNGNAYQSGTIAPICINNSYCDQNSSDVPNYRYTNQTDAAKNEQSELQCKVNADCRDVGRSSQVFEER